MDEVIVTALIVPSATSDGRACVESLQVQTLKNIEIIVGTDWRKARGKYIYIIDGDGMIFDNGLELLVNVAESSGADIVHSTAFVERDGDKVSVIADKPSLTGNIDQKSVFAADGFHLATALNIYRRDFIERHKLEIRSSDAFSYAAFFVADKIEFIDDYFYVKTVVKPAKIIDDAPDSLIDNINHDEFRNGFLVTSQRKKLWNVHLHLIAEFDRICRKHNLKWFIYAGTLLGAARHHGFIPWDDDVDLAMFRPDYERLKKVIAEELNPNYSVDFWYNYAIEGEKNREHLPVISRKTFDSNAWWPSTACYLKIRDNRTSMIEWPDRPNVNQGIWIDIFPLDPVPPFTDARQQQQFKLVTELMLAVSAPQVIRDALKSKQPLIDRRLLRDVLKLPFKQRALAYEKFLADNHYESEHVAHINSIVAYRREYIWRRDYWRELIEMPFERVKLPAPIDYDKVLAAHYGDWHEMIITHSHIGDYSADVSSADYFKLIAPEVLERQLRLKEAIANG